MKKFPFSAFLSLLLLTACGKEGPSAAADVSVRPASLPAAGENADKGASVRIDFGNAVMKGDAPAGWKYKGKPGTPDARFEIVRDPETGRNVLKMTADRASGVILFDLKDVDLVRYPVMRWKWKAEELPDGADARVKEKDDQGISLYVGCGRFRQTSVSYAWQTETPKGLQGKSVYNGLVTTFWTSCRDKSDGLGKWYVEAYPVADDIRAKFGGGELPSGLALTISTNSQYTGTRAVCFLEYIEFSEK